MSNAGTSPVDFTTQLGQVRGLVGDTQSVPLNPPVSGQADYGYFSDDELTAFLNASSLSTLRAVGWAYLQLAGGKAINMALVGTADLKVDTTKTAPELRAIANDYFAKADEQDARDAENGFDIGNSGYRRPYYGLRFPLNPEYVPLGSWPPEGWGDNSDIPPGYEPA